MLYILWDGWPIPTSGLIVVTSFGLYKRPDPPKPRFRRSRSSRSRYRRFRRRHLHYHLVLRCYSRQFAAAPWSYRTRQHRRWRRRKYRQRAHYRVKRHQLKWQKFLTPQQQSRVLWNTHRKVNAAFLGADSDPFLPFTTYGLIPEEVLDKFCADRAHTLLSTVRLIEKFNNMSMVDGANNAVKRANLFHSAESEVGHRASQATFKTCPLVWDTGASFGLTPFRGDFIDYTECTITIRDIARTNTVIGVGTTLHKFKIDGKDIFLPCLSYHLPSAEIWLFSPQTYHMIYGGHSTVTGDTVEKFIDHLRIKIPVETCGSNVPMIYGSAVSPREMKDHGPFIRSALPQYQRKSNALGSFSDGMFRDWNISTVAVDEEFDKYGSTMGHAFPGVGVPDNRNLSSAQKELLLWHWKLGISMQRVQELMKVAEMHEESGAVTAMDRVIKPKIKSAANCPIPVCQSCQLSRAKLRKPKVTKSKAISDQEGALSRDKYCTGDFVSMDQYVVKTPGRLPTGYGKEAGHNMFHGGILFSGMLLQSIFMLKIRFLLLLVRQLTQRSHLKTGCGSKLGLL